MKTRIIPVLFTIFWLISVVTSCTMSKTMALNSVELTNQLRPGMTYEEVVEILGNPKSSYMVDGKWIARWNLQEMWKGYIPYDFVFEPDSRKLISWSENQQAYAQKQAQMKELADDIEEASRESANSASGSNSPNIQNNPQLMQSFAGSYYSFSSAGLAYSGGTEKKVMLCPNGKYYNQSESAYSNDAGTSDAWGAASQSGGGGTWKISGDMNNGTIVMINNKGEATTYKYRRCGNDCVYFGNNKFAYTGPPDCK